MTGAQGIFYYSLAFVIQTCNVARKYRTVHDMKKNQAARSFRPEADVGDLLDKAEKAGLVLTEIVNESVRRCGPDIIEQMIDEKLKTLKSLSFDEAQLHLAGMIAA